VISVKKTHLTLVAAALVFLSISCVFPTANATGDSENSWSLIATIPKADIQGVVTVDGKIYVVCKNSDSSNTNYVYDPKYDSWATETPTIQTSFPNADIRLTVYQSKIYCFGSGFSQVYDTKTRIWTPIACNRQTRGVATASTVDDKIYLVGGEVSNMKEPSTDMSDWVWPSDCDTIEMFDLAKNTWTNMTRAPSPIGDATSYVIDKKIYIKYGDFYVYDTQTFQWRTIQTNSSYWGHGSATTTGVHAPKCIYFFGDNLNWNYYGSTFDTYAYVFNVETETWGTAEPLPVNLFVPDTAVVDDIIYCFSSAVESSVVTKNEPSKIPGRLPYIQQDFVYTTPEHNYKYTPYGYSTNPLTTDQSAKNGNLETVNTSTLAIIITATIAGTVIGGITVTVIHFKHKHVKEKAP
jgi:hypothetical protein